VRAVIYSVSAWAGAMVRYVRLVQKGGKRTGAAELSVLDQARGLTPWAHGV
jgi:hypothetical protein